ncbi:MAG: C4-dicarboxylate ABC transporter substrate-binding protein [Hyphomicrobiales bacterium]|nr:MAG: C4-dicarboxylate ABC transporter substrate-binding protein [Hyphomicrobiales bacterium]
MKFNYKSFRFYTAATIVASSLIISASQTFAAEYLANIGHLESAQQSRHVHLEKVAKLVNERTNGEVTFKLFPQSQLGNQRQLNEGTQLGTIQATVAPAAFLGGFNPAISILDIPFLLPTNPDHAHQLRTGPFGQALLKTFESKGLVGVALWPNGLKNFTSSKPLDDISAFEGQKFRVMDSKILIKQFDALGASAIALPFSELYTSLQTGVIDGQENPLDTIQRMKFFEVQKYLTISEHGAMEDVILFNSAWWAALPDDYKTIIIEAFAEVVPELRAHKAASIKTALEVIGNSDINIRVVSEQEKQEFRAKMYEPTINAFLERYGDKGQALIDLYEEEYSKLK